jgi:hypothetical protein
MAPQFKVTRTEMGAVPIFDRPPARRQIQGRIDGDKVGLRPPDIIENIPVLKEEICGRFELPQQAGSRRTAGDPGQVNSDDDEFFHADSPTRLKKILKYSILGKLFV